MKVSINKNVKKCSVEKFVKNWKAKQIKEELNKLLTSTYLSSNHNWGFDFEDKYHFIYDNECYLFIFDKKIELRSDRENVFSANKTITHQIKNTEDIHEAYRHFWSLTAEGEEEF
jgi:hypothetical protein